MRIIISLIALAIFILLGIIFVWPKVTSPHRATAKDWSSIGVDCISGHTNINSHIHTTLKIYIDGKRQVIPADIGITATCMAELHIHDTFGRIHVESLQRGKQFTLQQFFDMWDEKLEKEGYDLKITIDGQLNQEFGNLVLKNKKQVLLNYTSKQKLD